MLVVVVICSKLHVFGCLPLSSYSLGFGTRSMEWWLINVKRVTQHLILPLGSGFVSYWHHKVHFSTCSSFPVGVASADCLRRKFWPKRRDFWHVGSSDPNVGTSDINWLVHFYSTLWLQLFGSLGLSSIFIYFVANLWGVVLFWFGVSILETPFTNRFRF